MNAPAMTSFISGATNGALSKIPLVDGDNYRQWSYAMKFLLKEEGVWKLVYPEPRTQAQEPAARAQGARSRATRSPTLQPPPTEADELRSAKAAYLIYQSWSPIPQSHIADEED